MLRLRVLVADDHRLMLTAVRIALEADGDVEVVAEATAGTQVLPLVARTEPDVALLDIRMPGLDGFTALELIRNRHPRVKVVLMSGNDDPELARTALARGATAFIAKSIEPRDLAAALRQAVHGTVFQSLGRPEEYATATAMATGLSSRELEILRLLAGGLSNREIARRLWLAEQTVKFHLTHVYRKLGVANRTDAVRYAYRHGLADGQTEEPLGARPTLREVAG